jgi:uncharacterized protein YchJ
MFRKSINTLFPAFGIFKAKLSSGDMVEKSRFLKLGNRWVYESALG